MTIIFAAIGITAFGAITVRFFGHVERVPEKAENR